MGVLHVCVYACMYVRMCYMYVYGAQGQKRVSDSQNWSYREFWGHVNGGCSGEHQGL